MKYKNRNEEGAYKQHSILDEIVLDGVLPHIQIQYYDYPNKSKLPYQLHQLLVIDWFVRMASCNDRRWSRNATTLCPCHATRISNRFSSSYACSPPFPVVQPEREGE